MQINVYEIDLDNMPENLKAPFDAIQIMMTDDAEFERRLGCKPGDMETRQEMVFAWIKENMGEQVATLQATFEKMVVKPTQH